MPKLKRAALFCCICLCRGCGVVARRWNQPLQHQQISQWIQGKAGLLRGVRCRFGKFPASASGTGDGSKWAKARLDKAPQRRTISAFFGENADLDARHAVPSFPQGRDSLVFFGSEQADVGSAHSLQQCEQTAEAGAGGLAGQNR